MFVRDDSTKVFRVGIHGDLRPRESEAAVGGEAAIEFVAFVRVQGHVINAAYVQRGGGVGGEIDDARILRVEALRASVVVLRRVNRSAALRDKATFPPGAGPACVAVVDAIFFQSLAF